MCVCVCVCVYDHCMCHISAYGSTPLFLPLQQVYTHVRVVAIWFEVVRYIAHSVCISTLQLGGVGVWNLEAMRLLDRSRPLMGQHNACQRPNDRVSHVFLPIAAYSTGFGFPIVCLSCKPHHSQMRLVRLIIHLEEWKLLGGKNQNSSFPLFTAILQV